MITPNHPFWIQDLEDEVARLRSKILHLEEVNRSADQRAARTENRATQAEIQATQAESRANVLTAELGQCHDRVQRRDEHIRTLERQLRDVLPVFAMQPDALSERDVVRKAEALNEEIYQLCALVCGTVIISPDGELDAALAKSAKRKARETIGTELYGALRNSRQGDNEALLQFALQSAVSRLCEAKVGRWASGTSEMATELRAAYTSMREAEGARTAANWKVLTLKYLSKDDNARLLTTDEVLDALVPILCVGARMIPESETHLLSDGAEAIVGLTEELRHAVLVGICSQELDLTLPKADDPYVSAEMSVEEGNAVEGEKVVAGVALGVARRAGLAHSHTLLSAKVLVEDTVRRAQAATS
ncbi:hypothetical protein GGF50DRAFT_116818 [Schizophyllum commune]